MEVDANGVITGQSALNNFKTYLLPKAKINGVYCVLTLGPGSDWSAVANPENQKVEILANNVVNIINEYGFDGIDIDWEVPKTGEEAWFTNLLKVIREKVKQNNPNHLVTAAIGGGKWQPPKYDLNNSKAYLDYINMMLYDMSSQSGQYSNALFKSSNKHDNINNVGYTLTSCSVDESCKIFKNNYGIDYNKIIIGIPFYGRKQVLENGSWVKSKALSYQNIKNDYLTNPKYIYRFDDVCKVPYLISNDGLEFISYEDEVSISNKCQYIKDNNLAGIMYWQNGQDLTNTLLNAIKIGLK